MDIKEIIKSNLPEGADLTDKILSLIVKEIKTAQGEEFVPKADYRKKIDAIAELEKQIGEYQNNGTDVEAYKTKAADYETKIKELEAAHKEALKGKDTEITDLKTDYAAKETAAAKRAAARQALKILGANDEDLDVFLLDKVDYDKVELDGDKVKDPKHFEGYKEQYKRYFSDTVTIGAGVSTPPKAEHHAKYTMEQLKTMPIAQINANWDKGVKQALEGGK